MNDIESTTTSAGVEPASRAPAMAALYFGGLLAVCGAFFYLAGFEEPDPRPIGPPASLVAELDPALAYTPPAPAAPPSLGETAIALLAEGSDVPRWMFILGCAVSIWGLWQLRRLCPTGDPACDYLRSAYLDGVDPSSLHTDERLAEIQDAVIQRHHRKILWSLPFWFTALILLVVNKGTLGNETILGISDLWLLAITLGVYVLHTYLCWRCPACEAPLPKYDERLICNNCGLSLNAKRRSSSLASSANR